MLLEEMGTDSSMNLRIILGRASYLLLVTLHDAGSVQIIVRWTKVIDMCVTGFV
jgi:hypothetical protein